MVLAATQRILDLYDNDEFQIFVIEGNSGVGKSCYASRLIAEVYGMREQKKYGGDGIHPNWRKNVIRPRIGFHPQEVLDKWATMKRRDYCFAWDDAGFFLHSLDYQNKFVKAIGRSMQVMRTKFACIIFTCISRHDIINKIRNYESAIMIRIGKHENDPNSPYPSKKYRRHATAWHYWEDKLEKRGFQYDWEEFFTGRMPDHVYSWYKPLREKYANVAIRHSNKEMQRDKDIMAMKS